jgi:hypothetical protein
VGYGVGAGGLESAGGGEGAEEGGDEDGEGLHVCRSVGWLFWSREQRSERWVSGFVSVAVEMRLAVDVSMGCGYLVNAENIKDGCHVETRGGQPYIGISRNDFCIG